MVFLACTRVPALMSLVREFKWPCLADTDQNSCMGLWIRSALLMTTCAFRIKKLPLIRVACKAARDLALPHLYQVNPLQILHSRPLCLCLSLCLPGLCPRYPYSRPCPSLPIPSSDHAALLSSWGVSWKTEMSQVPFAPMVLGPWMFVERKGQGGNGCGCVL